MALIEGVGDEVTVLFAILACLLVLALAWVSTHTSEGTDSQPQPSQPSGTPTPARPTEAMATADSIPAESPGAEPPILRHRSPATQSELGTGVTATAPPPEEPLVLRLKFLNDSEQVARAWPQDTIGSLKRTQFPGREQQVRLIYQGQLLGDDTQTLGSLHLPPNCVLHCHVSTRVGPPHPPCPPGSEPGPSGLEIGSLLLPLLLLLLLVPTPAAGHGGKYSREKNEPERSSRREPGEEFRMEKLNQLWAKAQRLHLSPVKLAELHADLKIQERDELNWKKLKVEGLDEDGEKEAKLIHNLSVILARYGLDGRRDNQVVHSNALSDDTQDELGDPRLEKLWHKAQSSGKFSSEELDKLWRELLHHKEKVHEYNVLLEALSRAEEGFENVLNPSDMSHVKSDALYRKHGELKDKLRSITQGLDRLRKVSHQGYGPAAEFEEPRVIDLWDLAQTANFTEEELESFREELKHFEAKIEKHNHYQKQLEVSHQKLKHVESLGDREHISRNKEKYALLEEKTKELGYKVRKHLQDLSSRVSRARHNEL